ncbi:cyclophilin type peptidyl-prolyl cis-trans isomerase, putative [Trypanosoma equiperdum]|uniref:Peptidyl-prolyl cis-trans isomerase n=3 Tax=Trypanozoon TaxID=39700 RepID=Q581X3_TRYB2|nr:cyclophilin type peptidyl-prolyl cis-trans isomerase, putative [Trypanosoma brucei brucei TREU927]AAX79430.1 cyclophilin type peptidyl-prolyl cis-trans isomerase, putative [Trypanosoma brucei]AAZ12976.1 cyclophilin type peptidyl-prolyl cis-trans isomerase, putative [Trypanosoma brucei brucei TREU927]RHW70850.1 cyclophilin type peptidyl-prolyl cis-trans isomerase [Trypanosoma brucei equiperdum]SCU68288.1 cyclophilin type peptidyl-prolyl cis-trans isomerase, putative [Trypanosoma equiperdum]
MKVVVNEMSQVVEIITNEGVISVELYDTFAPRAAESFRRFAESGQLDGAVFDRMVPTFLLECRLSEFSVYGELVGREENNHLHHTGAGILTCFGTVLESGAFFITLGPQPELDNVCTIFGRVRSGMRVVEKISRSRVAEKTFRLYTPVVVERCLTRVLPKERRPECVGGEQLDVLPQSVSRHCGTQSSILNDLE